MNPSFLSHYPLSNPDEMFAIIKVFKPDIIILDVKLGNYDGKEICRHLQTHHSTKDIQAILHSAFPEIENKNELYGADEFILKPTNISHLISRLNFPLQSPEPG